jgi:hypothetical protein
LDSFLTGQAKRAAVRSIIVGCVLVAGGCQTASLQAPQPATAAASSSGPMYRLDAARSELHVLVYRAGPFARFGHNHVIAARALAGQLTLTGDVAGSTFDLLLPVDALDVDPESLRAQYGEDFASERSTADIDGTRANMLGAALLDSAAYPYVRVAGTVVRATESYAADVEIAVKETVVRRTTPVALTLTATTVTASGTLTFDHAELGLTPFSALLGAIRVADEIEFRFELVAERIDAQ